MSYEYRAELKKIISYLQFNRKVGRLNFSEAISVIMVVRYA